MNSRLSSLNSAISLDTHLEQIVESAIGRWQAGEPIDITALITEHPDYAAELRDLFPMIVRLVLLGNGPLGPGEPADTKGPLASLPYEQLGDFRLLREIGRGGMGVVYEAEQLSLGRRVALKVLPIVALADGKSLQRFRNEVRAVAALDHPHIVAVYSVGEERGVHFYAMQLIRGQTLADLIVHTRHSQESLVHPREFSSPTVDFVEIKSDDNPPLSTNQGDPPRVNTAAESRQMVEFHRTAARLGAQAAEALQHAHEQGVLHRDIKPSNLMLGDDGNLFVTDFGLARIEAEASITMTGNIVGTLRYMAPEQALAKRVVIDHRADVYSLGASLYEMLALRPAFTETDRSELLKQIAFEDPRSLRKLDRRIPADLETIVIKAMAKHPDERYQLAQHLADDLHAFLEDRPIQAKPPTLMDRAVKWSRRHQAVVWSVAAGLLLTVVLLAVSIVVISAARDDARRERDVGYHRLYVAHMRLAQQSWDRGEVSRMQELLDEHRPRPGRADLRGWEWYYLQSLPAQEELAFRGHSEGRDPIGVKSVAWSPDGRLVASAAFNTQEGNGLIKIWDPDTGAEIRTMRQPAQVLTMSWSPDGQHLATCSDDRILGIWDIGTGQRQLDITTGYDGNVPVTASWDTEGTRLASAGADSMIVIWNAKSGEPLQRLVGFKGDVCWIAWSPDGRSMAASGFGSDAGKVMIWDVESGRIQQTLRTGHRGLNRSVSWAPDSARIASGSEAGAAKVWNASSGELLLSLAHDSEVKQITFSPDGRRLATNSQGNRVTLLNATTGEVERTIQGHDRNLNSIAWSPNGKRLVTGAEDGLAKVWNVDRDPTILPRNDDVWGTLAWSPDDRLLAYGSRDNAIVICDAETGRRVHLLEGFDGLAISHMCWNSDGHYLASPGDNGTIRVWDVQSGKILHTWRHQDSQSPTQPIEEYVAIAWHPNGWQLASMSDVDGMVRVWDARTAKLIDSFASDNRSRTGGAYDTGVAWSPDGERLVTVDRWYGIQIWKVAGWQRLGVAQNDIILSSSKIAWSPNGRFLAASGSTEAPMKIIDTNTAQPIIAIFGQTGQAVLTWGSDGRQLLASRNGQSRLWDALTGDQLITLEGFAAWSHDRNRIAVISKGKIRIHDASVGYELASDPAHRQYRGQEHAARMLELSRVANDAQAMQHMDLALQLAPEDPVVLARAAWFLATSADRRFRDPARARELAKMAAPSRLTWQTIGIKSQILAKHAEVAEMLGLDSLASPLEAANLPPDH
jgi:eukaryotic-like serine/threonine-protein kinase